MLACAACFFLPLRCRRRAIITEQQRATSNSILLRNLPPPLRLLPLGRQPQRKRASQPAMEKAIDRQRVLLAHLVPSSSSSRPQLEVSSFPHLLLAFRLVWLTDLAGVRCSGVGVRGRGQRRVPEDLLLRRRCRRRRVSLLPTVFFPLLSSPLFLREYSYFSIALFRTTHSSTS